MPLGFLDSQRLIYSPQPWRPVVVQIQRIELVVFYPCDVVHHLASYHDRQAFYLWASFTNTYLVLTGANSALHNPHP